MVKEVPQFPKYECEGCDRIYTKLGNAQKCEAKGLPEFKHNIGDEVETIIPLTRMSEAIFRDSPIRLFDTGGEFAKVKITDRYHLNHKPAYTFEHPQNQGEYWRYPELAFELPDELNELKESVGDKTLEIKTNYGNYQSNERAMSFRIKWSAFRSYLRDHGIANAYMSKMVAQPINPR